MLDQFLLAQERIPKEKQSSMIERARKIEGSTSWKFSAFGPASGTATEINLFSAK
jgi:hypothetical protein